MYGGKESIGKAGFKLAKLNDEMGLFKLGGVNLDLYRSKSSVIIDVLDLNGNKPEFRLDENSAKHTWVGKVLAKDLDGTKENNQVFYKIISSQRGGREQVPYFLEN